MKVIITIVFVAVLFAGPVSADRMFLWNLTLSEIYDDEVDHDFKMKGIGITDLQIDTPRNLLISYSASILRGEDSVCEKEICVDYERLTVGVELELGYTFGKKFSPFASVSWSTTETDVSITGMAFSDMSTDDSMLGIGAYLGEQDRWIKLSASGLKRDTSVSFGGYFALKNNFVRSVALSAATENPMDSWEVTLGFGRFVIAR